MKFTVHTKIRHGYAEKCKAWGAFPIKKLSPCDPYAMKLSAEASVLMHIGDAS